MDRKKNSKRDKSSFSYPFVRYPPAIRSMFSTLSSQIVLRLHTMLEEPCLLLYKLPNDAGT